MLKNYLLQEVGSWCPQESEIFFFSLYFWYTRIRDSERMCWTPDSERWTLERWTLDVGCLTLDAGLWTLNAGLKALETMEIY